MKWLLGGAVLVVAGCGDADVPGAEGSGEAVYVGAVSQAEADAVVALVARGDDVSFYVCGGAATVESRTHWLAGSVASHALEVESAGWSASGAVDAELATGTLVTADGATLDWSAERVAPGTIAGLYGTVDEGCKTGVVVSQASADAAPTMQGAWCSQAGTKMQVTPILPISLTEQGIAVQVALAEGERRLQVRPVHAN